MDLLVDFEVIKCLGQGGFGSVLLVKDRRANKEYAIKLIPLSRSRETDVAGTVVREVETLAKMSNIEGIVNYHHSWYQDFTTPESFEDFKQNLQEVTGNSIHLSECLSSGSSDDGIQVDVSRLLFIKMDYFQGVNMKEWLRSLCITDGQQPDGAMTQPWVHGQILLAFHKILETVHRIHRMDVLHRDLKPENILFKDPCEVCICDFGLSKCVVGNEGGGGSDHAQHTCNIGTRAYLAPELLENPPLPHSRQSDSYALGLVFLEMLTIFGSDTESEKFEIFKCHKEGEIHPKAAKFKHETDLIQRLILENPRKRCSIEEALNDKLFNTVPFCCNICNLSDILGIECFKQHLVGNRHQKNIAKWSNRTYQTGQKQMASDTPAGGLDFFCDVCQIAATGQDNFMAHLAGQKHKKRQKLQQNVSVISEPVQQTVSATDKGDSQRTDNEDSVSELTTLRSDVDDLKTRMGNMETKLDQILMLLQK